MHIAPDHRGDRDEGDDRGRPAKGATPGASFARRRNVRASLTCDRRDGVRSRGHTTRHRQRSRQRLSSSPDLRARAERAASALRMLPGETSMRPRAVAALGSGGWSVSPDPLDVIVVDDDPLSRAALRTAVTGLGAPGAGAHQTRDGGRSPRTPSASMRTSVVSDWAMPEMDRMELCRRVRALPRRRAYTYLPLHQRGHAMKRDFVSAVRAGADDYLPKPIDPDDLEARLDRGRPCAGGVQGASPSATCGFRADSQAFFRAARIWTRSSGCRTASSSRRTLASGPPAPDRPPRWGRHRGDVRPRSSSSATTIDTATCAGDEVLEAYRAPHRARPAARRPSLSLRR